MNIPEEDKSDLWKEIEFQMRNGVNIDNLYSIEHENRGWYGTLFSVIVTLLNAYHSKGERQKDSIEFALYEIEKILDGIPFSRKEEDGILKMREMGILSVGEVLPEWFLKEKKLEGKVRQDRFGRYFVIPSDLWPERKPDE